MKKTFPLRLLFIWQCRVLMLFVILQSAIAALYSISQKLGVILAISNMIIFIIIIIYLILKYLSQHIKIEDNKIIYKRGVIFSRTTVIPNSSVMVITNLRLPLNRLFKLNLIIIRGGRFAVMIDGLTENEVKQISSNLVK